MAKRAHVPCDGCVACCINDAIILHPECGDDPSVYETEDIRHPFTGKPAKMLKHKPNGECIYLGKGGCTIHDRAPAICREFDCRRQFLQFSRNDRRRFIKAGVMDKEKFEPGRKRLHTLPERAA